MNQNAPNTGSPLTDEVIRRMLRHAKVGWAFAYIGLALMGGALWTLMDTRSTLGRMSVQLDEKAALLKESVSNDVKLILTDHTLPKSIPSREALVAYFQGDGRFVLDRYVEKDEQAAFLAALAPDPAVLGRYEGKYTNAAGQSRVHVFDVKAAVEHIVK